MFVLSKLSWLLLQPGNLLVLLLCAGLALTAAGRRRGGMTLICLATASLVVIAVLPVGTWALAPLEDRFERPATLPARVDGIIVLGGAVDVHLSDARGEPVLGDSVERLLALADLAEHYPDAAVVYTGGSGSLRYQGAREAPIVQRMAHRLGLAERPVLWEGAARNTHENAVLGYALARPAPDSTWLLVTSAWHMPRAVGTFRAAGWPVTPYPTDYLTDGGLDPWRIGFDLSFNLRLLSAAVREWVGLVAYRVLGRTDALFPAPETGRAD